MNYNYLTSFNTERNYNNDYGNDHRIKQHDYISEMTVKNEQIDNMQLAQEQLIQRNNDLERNILRLQNTVCKMNQLDKSKDDHRNNHNIICNTQSNNNNKNNQPTKAYPIKRIREEAMNISIKDLNIETCYQTFKTAKLKAKTKQKLSSNLSEGKVLSQSKSISKSKSRPKRNNISSFIPKSKTFNNFTMNNNTQQIQDKENEELSQQIIQLEKTIKNLNEELTLNLLAENGEDLLKYKTDQWKKRNSILSQNSIENLYQIKEKVFNHRMEYQNEIKNISNYCDYMITSLKEKCDNTTQKQNETIKIYQHNNALIKKRLEKASNILGKNLKYK